MKKLFLLFFLLHFVSFSSFGQTADEYSKSGFDKNKAIELNPNDDGLVSIDKNGNVLRADTYYNRGLAKAKLKDFYGSISDFNKTIKFDPNYAKAYNNRGASKYYINDLKGACEDAKKSKSLGYDASKLIQLTCN